MNQHAVYEPPFCSLVLVEGTSEFLGIESLSTVLEEISAPTSSHVAQPALRAALLTGGIDRPYAYGLAMSLAARNVDLDVIGNEIVDSPEMHTTPNLRFVNLWPGGSGKANALAKCVRIARHYVSLLRYAAFAQPRVFHILWNSKVQLFDRTVLMLYYKALGKKVTLTAHNVNQAKRDAKDSGLTKAVAKDSSLNRLTLRLQYHLADHIFVHTGKMKNELVTEFGVADGNVTVIRHPLNDAFPDTEMTCAEAKRKLGIREDEKALLCFGRIKPYKGIEHLLAALRLLSESDPSYRLIVAGEVQKGNEAYFGALTQSFKREVDDGQVILKTHFIPDSEMEVYLKAADVLILPYNEIFQSGVLFLGYSFGLPVIATDVGSFREEIVEGETGYICRPSDPADLAAKIETYFGSELYRNLDKHRQRIREHARIHHSWGAVADLTQDVYARLLGDSRA
jgi:glycosyltransferase involved in cell wall biosynthesis